MAALLLWRCGHPHLIMCQASTAHELKDAKQAAMLAAMRVDDEQHNTGRLQGSCQSRRLDVPMHAATAEMDSAPSAC